MPNEVHGKGEYMCKCKQLVKIIKSFEHINNDHYEANNVALAINNGNLTVYDKINETMEVIKFKYCPTCGCKNEK